VVDDRLSNETARLMRGAALAAVVTGIFLVAVKIVAYVVTDSVAMLASLADSALDIVGSTVNLLAVRRALMPADADHRFGHTKAEPLAGLAQGAFIAGSALFLAVEAIERLVEPRPVSNAAIGLAVMAVSIVAAAVLVLLQRFVVRRTDSIAIDADRLHYSADILINAGVIVALVLTVHFGMPLADPIIGLIVAGVLVFGAWHIFRRSADQLMDREMPEAARAKIKAIVRAHPAARGLHDLRTRVAGTRTFIQLHVEFDPDAPLLAVHTASDQIDDALQAAFPHAEIIIHHDPAGLEKVSDLAQT
jgi:ferrous-iron efflux pump FieF